MPASQHQNPKSDIEIAQAAKPRRILDIAKEKLGIAAEVSHFYDDLPRRIANAHLIIGRSGASTIAELMAIGRRVGLEVVRV